MRSLMLSPSPLPRCRAAGGANIFLAGSMPSSPWERPVRWRLNLKNPKSRNRCRETDLLEKTRLGWRRQTWNIHTLWPPTKSPFHQEQLADP